jgi:hypothetical protein
MNQLHQQKRGMAGRRRVSQAFAILATAIAVTDCSEDNITSRDDRVIARITPSSRVDTSFVGDVIDYEVPKFYTAANDNVSVGGFKALWSSDKSTIASKQGPALQDIPTRCSPLSDSDCPTSIRVSIGVTGQGEATVTMVPTAVNVAPGVSYKHKLYVLPAPPDILDAPSFLRIAQGTSTLLYAPPINSSGPRVTTGSTTWIAQQPLIAAVQVIEDIPDPTLIQEINQLSGAIVSSPTLPVVVKGVSAGQAAIVIVWTNGIRRMQKTVQVIVVPPSLTIAAEPRGPANDLSNSQTRVQVGTTRQYVGLNEEDAIVSTTWTSLTTSVATITNTGLATCRSVGSADIRGDRNGTSFTSTVSLTCFAAEQPIFAITPSVLSLATGARSGLSADVRNVGPTFSIVWTTSDASVVTVATDGSTAASVVGSNKLIRSASADVFADLTAGSITRRASSRITVAAAPLVVLPAQPAAVAAGQTQQFTLNTTDALGPNGVVPNAEVTWISSNAAVATVTDQGLARCGTTSLTGGVASIIGSVKNTTRSGAGALTCMGTAPVVVTQIVIGPANKSTAAGATVQYSVVYKGAAGQDVAAEPGSVTSFATDLSSVATIDSKTGLATGVGAGTTQVQAAYSMPGTTRQTIVVKTPITVSAAVSQVVAVYLDPVASEITLPASIKYVAHLFNAANVEIAVESNGRIDYSSAQPTLLLVDTPTGQAIGMGAGSTNVTAKYVWNGQTVKTSAASSVTIYPAGTAGHYTSVEIAIPTGGSKNPATARQIKVGETVEFELTIKDPNGLSVPFNVLQGLEFTLSDPAVTTPVHSVGTNLLRYTFRATNLPATLPGVPSVVTLKVDVMGAMVTVPIVVVP